MSDIVQSVEEIVLKGLTVQADGILYSPRKMEPVYDTREVEAVKISTLTGLVDFLKADIDPANRPKIFAVVNNVNNVIVQTALDMGTKQRTNYIEVNLLDFSARFSYGDFMPVENFIIKLRSLFATTPDMQALLQYVSKLTANNSITTTDDGISQSAVIKKGMSGALVENAITPSMVVLKPWRTFREIAQPESTFLFRLSDNTNSKVPMCALFEADGGVWRIQAMANIKEFLQKTIADLTVIA